MKWSCEIAAFSVCLRGLLSTHEGIRRIIMKFGMYNMAPDPISPAYFINPFHQCACLYACASFVASQRLGTNISDATNTHATIEELLNTSLFMWSMSYSGR